MAAACLLAGYAAAQDLPAAQPESVGLSSERLARIAAAVDRSIQEKRIAGAVTLVVRHGHVAWLKAQGMLDREAGKPMPADGIFRICSMTKPITSLAVMMLYEDGRFLLDDPVSKYIPEFKNPKVLVKPANGPSYTIPASHEITPPASLINGTAIWARCTKTPTSPAGYCRTTARSATASSGWPACPCSSIPASVSNTAWVLTFSATWWKCCRARPSTSFSGRASLPRWVCTTLISIRRKTGYPEKGLSRFPDKPIEEGPFAYSADYPYHGPKRLYAGGAGLCSTAMDYARFCQMMLNGGRAGATRLISRKTVELMTTDRLGKIGPDQGFGLGFGIEGVKSPLEELGSPGEYNWGGFFYTAFSVDPKEDMITVFMAQLHPAGDLALDRLVHVLAYQAIAD